MRLELEQAARRRDALDDALGVVEPLHADADLVAARHVEAHVHALARLVTGTARASGAGGHSIEMG
jgi:hypothetical protein